VTDAHLAAGDDVPHEGRSPRWPRWWPKDVALIHLCSGVIVVLTAYAGHLPFLWLVDTLAHRPSWIGLTVAWVLGTALYFLAWHQIGQYNRPVEVLVTLALILNALWAVETLFVGLLQVSGIGVRGLLVGTLPWVLRLVVAVVTLAAVLLYFRLGRAADDTEPLRSATPPPAAVVVSAVGFLLAAWSLALLAPPQADPAGAVKAVAAASRSDVKTTDVVAFQDSVENVVERESAVYPRDRWGTVRGFFSKDGKVVYDNTIQWGVLISYRDELTCVASTVKTHVVVVRPGFCPG
jgi:hypothetical protein